jgi:hypothetical protein
MALNARDLTVAKTSVAAELIAAAVWQAADQMDGNSPIIESSRRQLRRHAHELLELHDIKPDEVLFDSGIAAATPGAQDWQS